MDYIDIFYKPTWNVSFVKVSVISFLSESSCPVGLCPISDGGIISKLVVQI